MTDGLSAWGWSENWQKAWDEAIRTDSNFARCVPARIISEHRGQFEVIVPSGARERAEPRGRLRKPGNIWPAVGDWVVLGHEPTGTVLIEQVLPRSTTLKRLAAGESGEVQILATNIDIVFVTTSLNQDFNPRKIERFVVAARDSGAKVVLLLTKADLSDVALASVDEMRQRLGGVAVIPTSVQTGEGLSALRAYFHTGMSAVFLGASGVGKSSLVNSLLGDQTQTVGTIRGDDDKGRHTTTGRQSFVLPTGGLIIDTPGIRELQLTDVGSRVEEEFEDIEALTLRCKFTNCRHESEKGCAIRAALESGALDSDRYTSYLKLKAEAASRRKRR